MGKVWAATPDLEVPVALQPPAQRVKIVDVEAERARKVKSKAFPAAYCKEAVLMQYTVDTGLDRALTDALEAACMARLLRGNPMHLVLRRVKACAQFFELYREADRAVLDAYTQLLSKLKRAPHLLVATCTSTFSATEVMAQLQQLAPAAVIHGTTSHRGCISRDGRQTFGLLGIYDPDGRYATAVGHGAADVASAKAAGRNAARLALQSEAS